MNHALLIVSVLACAIAALIDMRTGHIPNWLTLGVFLVAPVLRAIAALYHPHPWASAALAATGSLTTGVLSAIAPLILARKGGLGLGDVKLFAAIGSASGLFVAVYAQTYAYVFAMVYALALVLRKKTLKRTLLNIRKLCTHAGTPERAHEGADPHGGFTEIKFGPAILAGMCVAAFTQWGSS